MFQKEKVKLPESTYWTLLVYFSAIGGLAISGADTADMIDLFERIGLDGNGILTLVGIYVAYVLVRRQLSQVDTNNALKNFKENVYTTSEKVFRCNAEYGLIIEENKSNRYIAAWRIDDMKPLSDSFIFYKFNFLVHVLKDTEKFKDVMEELREGRDSDLWSYRIIVSRINERYGRILEMSDFGGIKDMNDHQYKCIAHAMARIQLLDHDGMNKCISDLHRYGLKEANDEILDEDVFEGRPSEYG